MVTEKAEATDTGTEGKETEVSEPSEDVKEPSSEPTEAEKEEKETPEPEETFEAKVDRLAQSKADKSLVTLQQANEKLTTERDEARVEANEKLWDRNNASLFGEDSEADNKDEAVVARRKTDREKVKAQVFEYQENAAKVAKLKPELDAKETSLNDVERTHLVREKLWPLFFPEEKKDLSAYHDAFKRFDNANDPDDVEVILEGIRELLKGKAKKFVPDSGNQGGGGAIDLTKLSGKQLLILGEKEKEKKKK